MDLEKEVSKLLDSAYRYLGFRARTRKEMIDYLQKKAEKFNFSVEAIEQALQYLEESDYINDSSFIDLYVSSRNHLKPKSTYALTIELLQKGVNRDLIDSYFEDHSLDEETLARKAIQRKWSSWSRLERLNRFKKASSFLQRRGFPYSIVKKTIEEMESEE